MLDDVPPGHVGLPDDDGRFRNSGGPAGEELAVATDQP
jgi:hypothetical protein